MPSRSWRTSSLQFPRILVVAAQRATAVSLGEMLRGFGPHGSIDWTASSEEAAERAARWQPSLLFVDRIGGQIDGLAFVRRFLFQPRPLLGNFVLFFDQFGFDFDFFNRAVLGVLKINLQL
jgi:CheY-like chemotaxis protein